MKIQTASLKFLCPFLVFTQLYFGDHCPYKWAKYDKTSLWGHSGMLSFVNIYWWNRNVYIGPHNFQFI